MHAAGQPRLLDACQNAGMGAAAPRRQNDMVDTAAFSLCLRNQLGERVTIGEAAKGVRAANRDEIRAPPWPASLANVAAITAVLSSSGARIRSSAPKIWSSSTFPLIR